VNLFGASNLKLVASLVRFLEHLCISITFCFNDSDKELGSKLLEYKIIEIQEQLAGFIMDEMVVEDGKFNILFEPLNQSDLFVIYTLLIKSCCMIEV
jgi:hypothetical protein